MKKNLTRFLLFPCVLSMLALTVQAKTFTGDEGWQVNFTQEEKMESNFTTANLTDLISGMQPGDDAVITLGLRNSHSAVTSWYMTNEVLSSLEDSVAVAGGGAYTYQLTYVGPDGEEDVLFDSDTVGGEDVGEAGEGLNEVTNALDEYFFLDTLKSGESGKITLRVALDGETQGNDYQDTLAKLQMNFAVELDDTTTGSGDRLHRIVKTGSQSMVPYIIAAGVSGLLLLAFAIYSLRTRRKKGDGKMKKLLPCLLAVGMIVSFAVGFAAPFALPVSAAENYTYTVRIFAGAQGTIGGQDVVTVSDLHYGDRVDFAIGSVVLGNDSKYYVKGIRESGKDNNTVSASSIFVTEDVDYVVAYGLKGSSVAYVVHYVDADGNELYPATTYYGNVGDKPVVSYQYIEGYQPQAYNVTGTLSENAAENVFTFTYTRLENAQENTTSENNDENEENSPVTVRPVEDISDEDVPAANPEGGEDGQPAQIEDIDESKVPLANPAGAISKIIANAVALPLKKKMTIGGCILLVFGFGAWLLLCRRKKKDDET